jgi:hypothetical protein
MINSMLNHVALLKPPLPQLNVELVSWYITKSFSALFTTLNWGGGETKFVSSMFNNFVILAVSRVMSEIACSVDCETACLVLLDP